MITREIFQSHLDCKYKAYLKRFNPMTLPQPTPYSLMLDELEMGYRNDLIEDISQKLGVCQALDSAKTATSMIDGKDTLVFACFANQHILVTVDILQKIKGKSKLGSFHYQPVVTVRRSTVSANDKLMLGFLSILLADAQGRTPQFGKIIFGKGKKPLRIRLAKFVTRARKIVETLSFETIEPKLFLNRHCKHCEYQHSCHKKAVEKDDLSLLSRISLKEVESLNRRGIFTVTQLSHKFRPQRRHKSLEQKKKPHSYSLHALAIRESKIHVYNCAPIPKSNIEFFLDVECDLDREFYYLIGLKLRHNERIKHHQFWANQPDQEEVIFRQFLQVIRPYAEFKLFHFGSFELRFLRTMARRLGLENDNVVQKILDASVNVIDYTYSSIYFPTYSYDLKSLAGFLGHKWTDPDASGLQSMVWRRCWEKGDKRIRQILLQYNKEDITALELVADYIRKATSSDLAKAEGNEIVNAETLGNQQPVRWGPIQFVSPEMREINDCAYYDYQRDRVYFRTERKRRSIISKRKTKRRRFDKVNQTIEYECRKCPNCESSNIEAKSRCSRFVVDIKFLEGGVKRWVTKLCSWSYQCNACRSSFTSSRYRPPNRKRMRITYAHGLQAWVLFQHLVNGQSFASIDENLIELFGIDIGKSMIFRFKNELHKKYSATYDQIRSELLNSGVLVVDEAKMKMSDAVGYAWVFANARNVFFIFRETRDGDFLLEFLKGFKGILISDFYAAYDSIPCVQQKCLIHLMRDLNEDVTKNPFDEDLKKITRGFTVLLRATVATIDEHGLRKSKLKQHLPAAKNFFTLVSDGQFSSEIAQKYQKRFVKNRDKLFTYLNHNNVPWNSNAAEHAIKHLARLRKRGMTSFTKARVDEYMRLISIYQTCEYRGLSFLRFLLSGRKKL